MIYLFKCEDCGKEQEIECKLADKDKQPCKECGAPPEKMKQLINSHIEPHVSWSTWKVGA